MERKLMRVKLFFDDSDPQNEGYAYRAYYSDNHQESEAYDEISTLITPSISTLLYHCETIAENLGGKNLQTLVCHSTQTTITTTTEN